jgi:lysophospholipid acyltransferase (LPLAT)-like uncharacterized protein
MKLNQPWMLSLAGIMSARIAQAVLATLDFKAVSCDPTTDPLHPQCNRRYLYVTWHECILVGLPLRAHAGMLGIASEHRDGELLNQSAAHLGWKMVRGSTSRGALSALKQLLRENDHHLNIAPDGPRGPRREMAQGAVYLASKAGLPLVCCGYGFNRPWRLNSWDRCVIPRPFSRARAIYGPPLMIPPQLNRTDVEYYRGVIEQLMNRLTLEAETWAESREQKPGEFRLQPGCVPSPLVRQPDAFRTPLSQPAARLVELLDCHAPTQPLPQCAA